MKMEVNVTIMVDDLGRRSHILQPVGKPAFVSENFNTRRDLSEALAADIVDLLEAK